MMSFSALLHFIDGKTDAFRRRTGALKQPLQNHTTNPWQNWIRVVFFPLGHTHWFCKTLRFEFSYLLSCLLVTFSTGKELSMSETVISSLSKLNAHVKWFMVLRSNKPYVNIELHFRRFSCSGPNYFGNKHVSNAGNRMEYIYSQIAVGVSRTGLWFSVLL